MITAAEIRIRDPFFLREGDKYYLFGTTDKDPWRSAEGFSCYCTRDLQNYAGPFPAFTPPENFWANKNFWAPEVHKISGSYYMFASFYRDGARRGTQILRADFPEGPYVPVSAEPYTPRDWDCLDGTFYEEDGKYYSVFAHEWLQVRDGTMELVELNRDLTAAVGVPRTLFHASDALWARPINGSTDCFVTDGPFLYRLECGRLAMLWSSFGESGYALGAAYSENGIHGPWVQEPAPLYGKDGGHGMLFRDMDGALRLSIHTPNETPLERPVLLRVREEKGRLALEATEA